MGHNRTGRLPKTERWRAVVSRLGASPEDAAGISRTTLIASEARLREFANDPVLAHSVWILGRVVEAARSSDFAAGLASLGLNPEVNTALGLVSSVGDQVRATAVERGRSTVLNEVAVESLRSTLVQAIGHQGPGLFGASLNDVQAALRPLGTEREFGNLGQRFFGEFLARTLTAAVERETANVSRPDGQRLRLDEIRSVSEAIKLHAYQSAAIVGDFAGRWFSKHDWQSGRSLTEAETSRFVGQALRKLRGEVRREAAL